MPIPVESLSIKLPSGYRAEKLRSAGGYKVFDRDAFVGYLAPAKGGWSWQLLGGAVGHASVWEPAQALVAMSQAAHTSGGYSL